VDEVDFLMRYDPEREETEVVEEYPSIPADDPGLAEAVSEMPDHNDVGENP
jgi:hypothetical protein